MVEVTPRLVYPLAKRQRQRSRLKCHCLSWLLMVFLVAQIGVAAAVTATGTSGIHLDPVAIAALGGVNVAIGAMLALLKGLNKGGSAYKSMRDMGDTIEFIDRTIQLLRYEESTPSDEPTRDPVKQADHAWELYHAGMVALSDVDIAAATALVDDGAAASTVDGKSTDAKQTRNIFHVKLQSPQVQTFSQGGDSAGGAPRPTLE